MFTTRRARHIAVARAEHRPALPTHRRRQPTRTASPERRP
jgi:hypothetical protein